MKDICVLIIVACICIMIGCAINEAFANSDINPSSTYIITCNDAE